ncbi:hypothetical protein KAR91_83990 [Candidatus Pacearchaeota archaeon]|nr:hypothetical protein [Candidatus Pacearchaeota archaeon]
MEEKKDIQIVDFKKLPVDFSSLKVTDADLAKLKEEYGTVPDCSTKEGYAIAKAGLLMFRTFRSKVKARQKELKADAIGYNKRVDTEANRIVDFVVALEEPMKEARKAEDAAKEKEREEKAEKEKERVAAIEKDINTIRNVVLDCHGKTSLELSGIIGSLEATEIAVERFAEHTPIAEAAKIEAVQRLEELRDQALETEKADEERKAEDERLAEERKKLDDERLENERKNKIKDKIQAIKDRGAYDPEATAEKIEGRIHVLENLTPSVDVFDEYMTEAEQAIKASLVALKAFYTMKVEQERLAAIKAEEEAKEEETQPKDAVIPPEETEPEETLPDDDVVDAEFIPNDAPLTDDEIRMEFTKALVTNHPSVPLPIANHIYWDIKDGKLPHVQLIGGE